MSTVKTLFVGVPATVNLAVQKGVDVTQWFRFYDGKIIEGSTQGAGGVIVLTVTAHGLLTGAEVLVQGAQDVNANGLWTITVINVNQYSLDTSVYSTNGTTQGLAGAVKDWTGYGAIGYALDSYGGSAIFTFTVTFNSYSDGLMSLSFAHTTANATVDSGIYYVVATNSGVVSRPLSGGITLVP